MNRFVFLCLTGTGVLASTYGCSQGGLNTPERSSSAGTGTATGGGTMMGTGGSVMSSGGTGGSVTSSGGTGATGGATGTGGASTGGTTGGSSGSGSSTGGSAGTSTGTGGGSAGMSVAGTSSGATGGSAGTATSMAGTGGTPSSGGMGAGGSAGMGMAGSGMSGMGAGGATDLVQLVAKPLKGFMWIGQCSDGSASGLDCPLNDLSTNMCPNASASDFTMRGEFRNTTLQLGGDTSTVYTINFEVRGIAGTRCYTGGTPAVAALASDPETNNNGWYVGGTPTDSKWNTYEIHVDPPVTGEKNLYYLNSFPSTPSGWCEKHETFPMKYTASFKVMGGGKLTMVIHDSNCLGQQNCGGPDSQPSCASPRTMDLTGMPAVTSPMPFTQPYKQSNGFYPQWLYFDVKSVTAG
jgi:hypothetical protein